jgi:peptidoglycan/xylan/chitin deacetylase (PgdA/CDA1 family)
MTDVLILCYHAVSRRWPADLAVTPAELERQLEFLASRGYRGTTFSEAVLSPPNGRVMCVTFDDAFASVLEYAFPILDALEIPGTVFAVTDFATAERPLSWPGIDHWRGGPHEEELRGLSWPQLSSLVEAGWEVGSHTATHPRLTQLRDRELAEELRRSKSACEEALGQPCAAVAYPYGDVDGRVVAAAAQAGYSAGAVLSHRVLRPRELSAPRVGVYRPDSYRRFRLKVLPSLRRVRTRVPRAEDALRR